MIFAILPVKDPRNAKQRLGGLLATSEREALARAMYEHVMEALCAARGFDRRIVVTNDAATAQAARRRGALAFEEHSQLSHSDSADAAARRAIELDATTIVLLPIDVPLVTPADIEGLLAPAPRPGVLIVPSADGTGTNALVRTPPDAIESRFGPGSFRLHLEQAEARGFAVEVARPPGLVFDLDTPHDVAELLARAADSRVAQLLRFQCASKL